jgi:hypothetical protein
MVVTSLAMQFPTLLTFPQTPVVDFYPCNHLFQFMIGCRVPCSINFAIPYLTRSTLIVTENSMKGRTFGVLKGIRVKLAVSLLSGSQNPAKSLSTKPSDCRCSGRRIRGREALFGCRSDNVSDGKQYRPWKDPGTVSVEKSV